MRVNSCIQKYDVEFQKRHYFFKKDTTFTRCAIPCTITSSNPSELSQNQLGVFYIKYKVMFQLLTVILIIKALNRNGA